MKLNRLRRRVRVRLFSIGDGEECSGLPRGNKRNVRTSDGLEAAFFYPRCIMHCEITLIGTEPSNKAPECKTCSKFHGHSDRFKGQEDVTTIIIEVPAEIKTILGSGCAAGC